MYKGYIGEIGPEWFLCHSRNLQWGSAETNSRGQLEVHESSVILRCFCWVVASKTGESPCVNPYKYYDILCCAMILWYISSDAILCYIMIYLWYIMLHYDILWYIMIYCDIPWYIMIYYDISWHIMIYYDVTWYIMTYNDILWYMLYFLHSHYMNSLNSKHTSHMHQTYRGFRK